MAGGEATTGTAAAATTTRSLQETPTWALATVCFMFIFGGLLIEYLIHRLTHLLKTRRKNALFEAVERLKSVLMLLGFLSLLLAVTQRPISKICIPNRLANSMLPCHKVIETKTTKALGYSYHDHVWAAYEADISHWERRLAEDDSSSSSECGEGKTSLMSAKGINQLSIFIFVIAVMQVVYSGITMGLGRAKMRRWKAWEKETQSTEYQAANDPNRFRFTRQTTFGRRHMSNCTTTPILWIKCFFRQFFHSVAKVDYFTLRHGFIAAHLSTNSTFNFQKYIRRSLEDDFKVVVGISPFMWLLVVIFLLVDVHGWYVYLWVSFLPLIIVLVIGTKLEVIVAKMALQLKDHNSVVKGTPVVQPNDNLFWFGNPEFVLTLIHFILFTNAFELAFFVFVTLQYGFHSCYHERVEIAIIRVVLAVIVQVLCSYITLPLYALVTQVIWGRKYCKLSMAGGEATTGTAAAATTTRSLQETPTWALATVCFMFIFGGLLIEYLIHRLTHLLKTRRKNALFEAVERLKSVLMLLGFLSLLLAVTQRPISKICIPNRLANSMLPCHKVIETKTTKALGYSYHDHVWAAYEADISHWERRLAEDDSSSSSECGEGKTSLMSAKGINQLSIFIFVIAVMQVVYSGITMGLGRAKMRRWKAWEKETQSTEYQAANDPNRFRFTRQTTFGRRHMSNCTTTPILWIKCFFRQFFHSVAKVDYFTLRHGFIAAHLSTNSTFNFQKYIRRSLEDDFKVVVGISPFMWLLVVIFLLVDVHGWYVYLWVSFLPLIIVLVIGTKLEVIVAKMALQLKDHNSVVKGTPVVQPNDNLFWFGNPEFVLTLIHFILFTNAFELAFFVFVTLQYGFHSCYHERVEIAIIRVVLAVIVQVLCSYITLPLYALVTQMGTHFKSAILEDQTAHVIRQWHAGVKDKRKKERAGSKSPRRDREGSVWSIDSRTNSPEISSHHRTPPTTLAQFASRRLPRDDGEIAAAEPSPAELSFADEVRIELRGDEKKTLV